MGALVPALAAIVAKLGWALLSEYVVSHVTVYTLEMAAKKSTNDVDDKIVEVVKKAWKID